MKRLNKKIKVWESKSVDQAVEEAEVESPGSIPSLPGDAQVEADGPPAEQEGGRQGDHDEGDLSWYGMAWYGMIRGQEGHNKSDLVRLWRFNAVLVELLDDQAVGDDDDDGRDEKDCDGDSPNPVGAKESRFNKNLWIPEKYF